MGDNLPEEIKKNELEVTNGKLGKSCPIRFEFDGEQEEERLSKIVVEDGFSGREALEMVFGTSAVDLINDIINKGTNAMGNFPLEEKLNTLAQSMADFEPRNAMEAKLCAQAQVLFSQGMRLISFANDENMMPQQAHCLKFAMQCLRLHNETLQTLHKLRRGGEQKVTVQHQHFHVNDGGKAAIMAGSFQVGGGDKEKSEG